MQRKMLVVVGASAAVSAVLAIVINVATGSAPQWIIALRPWAWLLVIAFGVVAIALAVWQRRLEGFQASPEVPGGTNRMPPRELPRDTSHFIARNDELSRLNSMARNSGIVAIAGKPGVGKSALAIHAAHMLSGRYPDGHIFLDLQGMRGSPLPVQAAMLHVIRAFTETDGFLGNDEDLAARYRSILAMKRAILILDDAEDESQVRLLLPPNDRCLVLITSRRGLAGLTEAPPPLILDTLDERDALAMLSAITGVSRIRAEAEASALLVHQCGALPLALRIAAARLRRRPHWSIATLVERLSDERRRLDELRVADLEVRACIALSYADLSISDARSFRRLSAIPGQDFSPELAGAAVEEAPPVAQTMLDDLADAQLLERQGFARYRYHDLIRIFAEERLFDEDGEAEHKATLLRVLPVYIGQLNVATEAMNIRSAVGVRALPGATSGDAPITFQVENPEVDASQWVQHERNNLLAALYAAQKVDVISAWRIAQSLLPFLENRSTIRELRAILTVAEQAASQLHGPEYVMSALYFRGRVARLDGNPSEAIRALTKSSQFFLHTNRTAEACEVLLVLGQTFRENGAHRQAAEALATAFQIQLARNDKASAAGVLIEIGIVLKGYGRLEDAARVLDFAISLLALESGPVQSKVRLAWAHENLGAILKHLGRTVQATMHHEASLAVFTDLGHIRGRAYAIRNLGDLALKAHELREAEERYTRSRLLFHDIGDRRGEAQSLGHLCLVHLRTNHWLHGTSELIRSILLARRSNSLRALIYQLRESSLQKSRQGANQFADPSLTQLVDVIEKSLGNGA